MPLAPIIDDSQGPRDPIDLAAAEAAAGVVRIAAADAPQSAVSHLSLGGFCPVSFVKQAGLLRRADASLGFVRYGLSRCSSFAGKFAECLVLNYVGACSD